MPRNGRAGVRAFSILIHGMSMSRCVVTRKSLVMQRGCAGRGLRSRTLPAVRFVQQPIHPRVKAGKRSGNLCLCVAV